MSGSAGTGGASNCPGTTPVTGMGCNNATPGGCLYQGTFCSCAVGNGGGGGKWVCIGGGAQSCDATAPSTGDVCTNDVRCPYPNGVICGCVAVTSGREWLCGGPSCPATSPQNADSCSPSMIGFCDYASGPCACNGSNWRCPNN